VNLTPGAPIKVAWVEAGSEAGFGRAGEFGGMLMVSLAADASAAAPRTERREEICILEARCQKEVSGYMNIRMSLYVALYHIARCNVGGSVA
jgi:hypothetical protein